MDFLFLALVAVFVAVIAALAFGCDALRAKS
jgi:hypothetical protein